MQRTLWIHIGIHKTGTTSIQSSFNTCRELLRAQGVYFPTTGLTKGKDQKTIEPRSGHQRLVHKWSNKQYDPRDQTSAELLSEIKSTDEPCILLSSEVASNPIRIFCATNIKRFSDYAREVNPRLNFKVKIIVYLRRQDRWVESFYKERLKWKNQIETREIERFVQEEGAWLDYELRLRPWEEIFGDDNIMVRAYENVSQNGVVRDLCQLLGVTPEITDIIAAKDTRRENLSLPPQMVNLMLAINRVSDYTKNEKEYIAKQVSTLDFLNVDCSGSIVSDKLWHYIKQTYAMGNQRLVEKYDLFDLTPLRFPENLKAKRKILPPVLSLAVAEELVVTLRRPGVLNSIPPITGTWGVMTTLRCSVDHTIRFVNYYLNMGVHHLILYFDDDHDPAIPLFENPSKITCIRCSRKYWAEQYGLQAAMTMTGKIKANMLHGQKLLRDKQVEWGICLDSDELIYVFKEDTECDHHRSVSDILESQPKRRGVVHLNPYESILTGLNDDILVFGARWFRTLAPENGGIRAKIRRLLNKNNRGITRSGFFGHIDGKAFIRTNLVLSKPIKHHNPKLVSANRGRVTPTSMVLLHYDCPPYKLWKKRWRRRVSGETNAANMGPKRQKQFNIIAAAMENDDQSVRKVYENWFVVGQLKLFAYRVAGMVTKILIPEKWFASPITRETKGTCLNKKSTSK